MDSGRDWVIYIAHCILNPLPHKTSWITNTVCAAEWDYTFGFLYCTLIMVGVYSYYKYIFIKINLAKVVSSCTSGILPRETSMQSAFASKKVQTVHFWQKVNSRCSSIKLIWGKFIWEQQISDAWWMTGLCLCDDWQEKDVKWISGRKKIKVANI